MADRRTTQGTTHLRPGPLPRLIACLALLFHVVLLPVHGAAQAAAMGPGALGQTIAVSDDTKSAGLPADLLKALGKFCAPGNLPGNLDGNLPGNLDGSGDHDGSTPSPSLPECGACHQCRSALTPPNAVGLPLHGLYGPRPAQWRGHTSLLRPRALPARPSLPRAPPAMVL